MLDAVTRTVVEKGYARMTVADIVAGAEVSRRTFYEQFDNKEECFLAAYEAGAQAVITDVVAAVRALSPADDWRVWTRVALEAFTAALASSPEFARVFLVDVLGAGHRAVELRQRVYDLFAERLRALNARAAERDPAVRPVSDLTLRALVGGIGELVQRQVLTEGAASLPTLNPALTQLAIRALEGASTTEAAPEP